MQRAWQNVSLKLNSTVPSIARVQPESRRVWENPHQEVQLTDPSHAMVSWASFDTSHRHAITAQAIQNRCDLAILVSWLLAYCVQAV